MILPVVVSNYIMVLPRMVIGVISLYLSGPRHNSTYNSGPISSRPKTRPGPPKGGVGSGKYRLVQGNLGVWVKSGLVETTSYQPAKAGFANLF